MFAAQHFLMQEVKQSFLDASRREARGFLPKCPKGVASDQKMHDSLQSFLLFP